MECDSWSTAAASGVRGCSDQAHRKTLPGRRPRTQHTGLAEPPGHHGFGQTTLPDAAQHGEDGNVDFRRHTGKQMNMEEETTLASIAEAVCTGRWRHCGKQPPVRRGLEQGRDKCVSRSSNRDYWEVPDRLAPGEPVYPPVGGRLLDEALLQHDADRAVAHWW